MSRTLLRISVLLSLFVLVCFAVVVVNQTAQVIQLAAEFNPKTGTIVLYALLSTYAILLLVPLYLFLRLPRQLAPPASRESPQYAVFPKILTKRLRSNPLLRHMTLETEAEIEAAIRVLDAEADRLARRSAATIFLTTAMSQNGSLDAMFVLSAQTRLIWQIAFLYYQRPSPRDFLRLYGNVAATAFVAGEIDDIDVEPAITALFGSGAAAVPGAHIIAASLVSGAANAFLTLRVAMIAKRYSDCLVQPERRLLRRSATAQAAGMVPGIVKDGSVQLVKAAAAIPKKILDSWIESISTHWTSISSRWSKNGAVAAGG
jgi:hypothetical protein